MNRSCAVIGGGVVGLAVAARLARSLTPGSVYVLERHGHIGEETSSRNSEVVHAGLYYPLDSLKMKTCLEGKQLLYETCSRWPSAIPIRRCTKWIVAQDDDEAQVLQEIHAKASLLGVPTRFLSAEEQHRQEPHVHASTVLESSSTGIVDSHALMLFLMARLEEREGVVACHTSVENIEGPSHEHGGYEVMTQDGPLHVDYVINCGGLWADNIAKLAMGARCPSDYQLYFCKGVYYAYQAASPVSRLIYPVPLPGLKGLGVHATIDLAGRMKIGPDAEYQESRTDTQVDGERLPGMVAAVKQYLPGVDETKFAPDYAGIRPKLSADGQPARDFVVEHEVAQGFPGLVNLLGIESPGLTASLALANHVAGLLDLAEL